MLDKMTRDDVIQAVKERLDKYHWYRGVCTDSIKGRLFFTLDEYRAAVDECEADTRYWDSGS